MSHKNFVTLDPEVIRAMCDRYRTGASVTDLKAEFGLGRNKIIRTLRENLDPEEYARCVKLSLSKIGAKIAPKLRGRKNPHTPEWNKKISEARTGQRHSEETKTLIGQRVRERELDPE